MSKEPMPRQRSKQTSGHPPLLRRESPNEKKQRVLASFTRKVELLESWVRDGLPTEQYWPRGPVELASWSDEGLKVSAWTKRNIVSPNGPYPELRQRFNETVRALERKPARNPERERQKLEKIRDLKAQIRALSEQIVGLLDRVQELTDDLARERQLRREKEVELAKLVPLQAIQRGHHG